MCELCSHDEAVTGQQLCAPCREAILRLANAVHAIQQRRAEQGNLQLSANRSADQYKTAFFDTKS
jgi:hypothetical protein